MKAETVTVLLLNGPDVHEETYTPDPSSVSIDAFVSRGDKTISLFGGNHVTVDLIVTMLHETGRL